MAKRFTATEIWGEDWFLEMPSEYKLFWYYMLSTCDHGGLFKVNVRSFRGLVGVEITPETALEHFNKGKSRIRVINNSVWLIEDFFVFQYGTTFNPNNKMHESIEKLYLKLDLKMTSIRGLTDLKDRVKEKEKEINTESKIQLVTNGAPQSATSFDENGEKAYFADGTYQPLGMEQRIAFRQQTLRPKDVKKGLSY
jgi:hypothetical protein